MQGSINNIFVIILRAVSAYGQTACLCTFCVFLIMFIWRRFSLAQTTQR